MTSMVFYDTLKGFRDAFKRHDLDAIMSCFADDCGFYMPRGIAPRGDQYAGKEQVRAGLATRFAGIPDMHYGDDKHWVFQDFGVSEWTLTGTTTTGKHIEVRGVDLASVSSESRPSHLHPWHMNLMPGRFEPYASQN